MVIGKELRLECAHNLPKHKNADGSPGKCSRLHGHSYLLQIWVRGPIDPATGMVMDFAELSEILDIHVDKVLDHRYINEVFLAYQWPGEATAENVARFIWQQVETHLPEHINIERIKLWETVKYNVEITSFDYFPEPSAEALTEEPSHG